MAIRKTSDDPADPSSFRVAPRKRKPTWAGWVAILIAFSPGIFLPALLPASFGDGSARPIVGGGWSVFLICAVGITPSILACGRHSMGDRILGGFGIALVLVSVLIFAIGAL